MTSDFMKDVSFHVVNDELYRKGLCIIMVMLQASVNIMKTRILYSYRQYNHIRYNNHCRVTATATFCLDAVKMLTRGELVTKLRLIMKDYDYKWTFLVKFH